MAWNSYADGSWLNLNSLAIYRQENQPCRRLTNKIPGVWLGKKAADQLVPLPGEVPEGAADADPDNAGEVGNHGTILNGALEHVTLRSRSDPPASRAFFQSRDRQGTEPVAWTVEAMKPAADPKRESAEDSHGGFFHSTRQHGTHPCIPVNRDTSL